MPNHNASSIRPDNGVPEPRTGIGSGIAITNLHHPQILQPILNQLLDFPVLGLVLVRAEGILRPPAGVLAVIEGRELGGLTEQRTELDTHTEREGAKPVSDSRIEHRGCSGETYQRPHLEGRIPLQSGHGHDREWQYAGKEEAREQPIQGPAREKNRKWCCRVERKARSGAGNNSRLFLNCPKTEA